MRRVREGAIKLALIGCAVLSVLTTVTIIGILIKQSIAFFSMPEVSFGEFITGTQWNPLLGAEKHFGIWPLVCGTFLVAGIAMLGAVPLGLVTAFYMS